jgi:class 3 adenylate cyclase
MRPPLKVWRRGGACLLGRHYRRPRDPRQAGEVVIGVVAARAYHRLRGADMERKLAAILAADVVGYARLMALPSCP